MRSAVRVRLSRFTATVLLTKTTASEYGLTNRLSDGREATINWTADGENVLNITYQGGCSPDGTKIAYISDEHVTEQENATSSAGLATNTTDIYVKTADGTGRITDTAEFSESSPVWSPDSKQIA